MKRSIMDRIRYRVWKLIGFPGQMEELFQEIRKHGGNPVIVYSYGQFAFSPMTSGGPDGNPIIFDTCEEREAFAKGLDFGVSLFGGTVQHLDQHELEEYEKQTNYKEKMN